MEVIDKFPGFPVYLIILIVISFVGIAAIIATSFLKIVVVLHITKSALGLQEVPPAMAINALALILTLYIMAPIGIQIRDNLAERNVDLENLKDPKIFTDVLESAEPLRGFLIKHSNPRERSFFMNSAKKLWPPEQVKTISESDLLIIIPAFTTTQLKSAFEVGFLIYLPFIIIDLIISNILLALGMIMVSPIVISMPFKLLLFVLVDGWSRLLHGLVLSYQ